MRSDESGKTFCSIALPTSELGIGTKFVFGNKPSTSSCRLLPVVGGLFGIRTSDLFGDGHLIHLTMGLF